MPATHQVYLEVGARRVFASALEWPGWCRSGRDEDSALQTLVDYGRRYKAAIGPAGRRFSPPKDLSALEVVERVKGNATTDFGAPGIPPASDDRPVDKAEGRRLTALLEVSWAAFDRTADSAVGIPLRKGPRGGGRDLDKIVGHVLHAETGYLPHIGGRYRPPKGADIADHVVEARAAVLEAMAARARGDPMPPKRGSVWSLRYFVRRDAWHVLDHAWEIEDRAEPDQS